MTYRLGACGEGTKLRLVRSLELRGLALLGATVLCIALPGIVATSGGSAQAGGSLEERKLPMRFTWVACQPDCRGWISAVGIVTTDSPGDFDDFARGRDLGGATIVLNSSGGSVNNFIALGRRFRSLGLMTTVGTSIAALWVSMLVPTVVIKPKNWRAPAERDEVVDRAAAGVQHDGRAAEVAPACEIQIAGAIGGHNADRADPAPAIGLALPR